MAANEVAESQEKGDDTASTATEKHSRVAKKHGNEEVEIGREAEREVGEGSSGERGVHVPSKCAGDEPHEEAHRNGGNEAEEKSEHRDAHSDGRRHGFHVEVHGRARD